MLTKIRYFIDPETDMPHIFNHDVSISEVEQVFRNFHFTQRGKISEVSGHASWIAQGQTDAGRFLRVVYSRDEEGAGIFVVTSYDLRGKELLAFRRRLRRRQR